MRQTWRKDDTLRTPIERVTKIKYNWEKRKISSTGRFPYKEKIKNSKEIRKIASKREKIKINDLLI